MDPLTLSAEVIKERLCFLNLLVLEVFESLPDEETNAAMRTMDFLHMKALNEIMKIKSERNWYEQVFHEVHVYIPLELI